MYVKCHIVCFSDAITLYLLLGHHTSFTHLFFLVIRVPPQFWWQGLQKADLFYSPHHFDGGWVIIPPKEQHQSELLCVVRSYVKNLYFCNRVSAHLEGVNAVEFSCLSHLSITCSNQQVLQYLFQHFLALLIINEQHARFKVNTPVTMRLCSNGLYRHSGGGSQL